MGPRKTGLQGAHEGYLQLGRRGGCLRHAPGACLRPARANALKVKVANASARAYATSFNAPRGKNSLELHLELLVRSHGSLGIGEVVALHDNRVRELANRLGLVVDGRGDRAHLFCPRGNARRPFRLASLRRRSREEVPGHVLLRASMNPVFWQQLGA